MENYGAKKPAGKLKDSCDVCSAFKLRCDKQKPICTRCSNLNYRCTYSPARRAGRSHAVRRESGQKQNQNQSQKRSKAPSRSSKDSFQQYFGVLDSDSLDLINRNESRKVDPTGIPGHIDSLTGLDNDCFPSTHTLGLHADSQSVEVPSSPCGSLNTRLDTDATKTDCTRVALSIVSQLETSKMWSGTAFTHGAGDLTATEACQRLLTILVCPCSEQAEVGLLVASACILLMDMVHGSVRPNSNQGLTSLALVSHGLSEPDILPWPRPPSSSHSSSSDGQGQLGDLFKIAKVILEFTDRYSQDTKGGLRLEHTSWVVAPVAALLRSQLQSVTQGATKRLVS